MDSVNAAIVVVSKNAETCKLVMASPPFPAEGSSSNSKAAVEASETHQSLEQQQQQPSSVVVVAAAGDIQVTPRRRPLVGSSSSRLNPFAREWDPLIQRAPEHHRSLFLTFSNGFPLTEEEIRTFFIENFDAVVETVYIHRPIPPLIDQQDPLFGKVVFSLMYTAFFIMHGVEKRIFVINGRPLWCKRFIAREERAPRDEHYYYY